MYENDKRKIIFQGLECVDLLRCMDILPKERVVPPPVCLPGEHLQDCNCNPE